MTDEIFDDEYLWDRTGEPDEELARLERVLARYRLRHPLPPFRRRPSALPRRRERRRVKETRRWIASSPPPAAENVMKYLLAR